MREILFRGKRLDNGEWVEGDLLRAKLYSDDAEHYFIFTDAEAFPANEFIGYAEVLPETIGQYTGLTDKNGKRVFEGDIVQVCSHWWSTSKLRYEQKSITRQVEYREAEGRFVGINGLNLISREVIGNIYDNPELLRGADG